MIGAAGEFTVHARVDGLYAGQMTVVAIGVGPVTPIACQVGFQREYEVEGETGEIDSQTQEPVIGDMTYVRTNHDGAAGDADPVAVQVTFRASPGEQVTGAVAIATNQNKRTWKAWVALTDDKIFEYRGRDKAHTDGSALTDDEKAEEVYELTLNDNGTIATEKQADRVVSFSLTADGNWFAGKVVYVYGIEASTALDDLKLTVWGEERMDWKAKALSAEAHHNQNHELVDEEPLPVKRWYITDEEPLNVLKMEYVTPNASQQLVPVDVTPTSDPNPVVTLNDLSETSFSLSGETATVTVSGNVRDPLADSVAGGTCEITELRIYANGELIQTLSTADLSKVAEPQSGVQGLIRPYAHRKEFMKQISFPVTDGGNEVYVEATNAVGNVGHDSAMMVLGRGASTSFTSVLNVHIAQPLAFGQADQVTFWSGDRAVEDADPEFAETAEDQPGNSSTFDGTYNEIQTQVVIANLTGLSDGAIDTFDGTVKFTVAGLTTEYAGVFEETTQTSKRFRLALTFTGGPGSPFVDSVTNEAGSPAGPFAPVLIRVDGAEGTLEGFTVFGQAFQVVEYEGQKFLGQSPPTVFVMTSEARSEVNFVTEAIVVVKDGLNLGTEYHVRANPKCLVVGQVNVPVEIELARTGVDFPFDVNTDSFYFQAQQAGELDVLVQNIHVPSRGKIAGTVSQVTQEMIGYKALVLNVGGIQSEVPFVIRVMPKCRLLLTFDDGPSVEPFAGKTPTESILDTLQGQNIKAAFFVLTTPDYFRKRTPPWTSQVFQKANTAEGFTLLRREVSEGHVVALHWGGTYYTQTNLHPSRLGMPAYDSTGDGEVDRATDPGNALESDLIECRQRIRQAYSAEGQAGYVPEFVRPPLWVFKFAAGPDARPTYSALALRMVLSDAKLGDGGYEGAGFTLETWLRNGIRRAVDLGQSDIIITMHDSNPDTARDLTSVIQYMRQAMVDMGLPEGVGYKFCDSTSEVLEIMRTKHFFALTPEVTVP